MSVHFKDMLNKAIAKEPDYIQYQDERGWTLMHTETLAGNYYSVKALLSKGAAPLIKNSDNETALDIAKRINWPRIVNLLSKTE